MRDQCAFVCINVCNGWGGAHHLASEWQDLKLERLYCVSIVACAYTYAHFRLCLIFISSFWLSFFFYPQLVPPEPLPSPSTTRFVLLFHYIFHFFLHPFQGETVRRRSMMHALRAVTARMCVHHAYYVPLIRNMYINNYTNPPRMYINICICVGEYFYNFTCIVHFHFESFPPYTHYKF